MRDSNKCPVNEAVTVVNEVVGIVGFRLVYP